MKQSSGTGTKTAPKTAGLIVRIPPPVWTLALLIVSYIVARLFALPVLLQSTGAAVALIVAGFGIVIWGAGTFARAGTELNPASEVNSKLVTHGPFRYMRNPMYSGLLLVTLGVALFFGTLPFFISVILLFVLVNAAFAPYEEAKMERQFGAEFRAYSSRVRRWGIW